MKKLIAVICFIALMVLSGCDQEETQYDYKYQRPNIAFVSRRGNFYNYYYIVDENTGVVYLQFDGNRRAGITVMLNIDGTPVTVDQIRKRDDAE